MAKPKNFSVEPTVMHCRSALYQDESLVLCVLELLGGGFMISRDILLLEDFVYLRFEQSYAPSLFYPRSYLYSIKDKTLGLEDIIQILRKKGFVNVKQQV